MPLKQLAVLILLAASLFACASEDVLTQEEVVIQNAADAAVAGLLFEQELTNTASYRVRKDGSVAIHFDKSVRFDVYDDIVRRLRKHKSIKSVYAEQAGREVCPMGQ